MNHDILECILESISRAPYDSNLWYLLGNLKKSKTKQMQVYKGKIFL